MFRFSVVAWLLLLIPTRSQAVEITPGLNIDIAPGWSITAQAQNADNQRSGTLILSAAANDPSRGATLSFFRLSSSAPPGEIELHETLSLAHLILGSGMQPTGERITRSDKTVAGDPMILVEITANAGRDQRIFTEAIYPASSIPLRFVASRTARDSEAGTEIERMMRSVVAPKGVGLLGISAHEFTLPPAGPSPLPANSITATRPNSALVASNHGALVIVEGNQGVGSGFLCRMDDKTYVITNTHVIENNLTIKLTTLGGEALLPGTSEIAIGQDTLRMAIETNVTPFQILPNPEENAKIGDAVVVLGNMEGARVVKVCEGKIVGIGPDLIEVDAPFVSGNSGSPMIHLKSGKVIGIATFLLERRSSASRTAAVVEVRRFGYRLDRVKGWETVQWPRFFAQSREVAKIVRLSEDFVRLAEDMHQTGKFDTSHYATPGLARIINTFEKRMQTSKMSPNDQTQALNGFFADLRQVSKADINAFDFKNSYDYFRRKVQEERKFRDLVHEGFTKMMQRR